MGKYDPVVYQLRQSKAFYKTGKEPRKSLYFYRYVCGHVLIPGLWLEFGTGRGSTMFQILPFVPGLIYGFDWFKGLPEEWAVSSTEIFPAGTFQISLEDYVITGTAEEIEQVQLVEDDFIDAAVVALENLTPKVQIVNGLFNETLPSFLAEHTETCAFIHVDCDLYSSTKNIFDLLGSRIVSGTVILFDEFYNYENYRDHEYKAFMEFAEETKLDYRFIAHVADKRQAAVVCL